MHIEILSEKQQELLDFIAQYKRSFYLVGGTAIALHIGHRRSIDFDLFTYTRLNKSRIKAKLLHIPYKTQIIFEDIDQLHYKINEVKVTFFNYPYPVEHPVKSQFSEKLFREQLAFHKDIDYSEEVEYVVTNPPTPDEIRYTLIEKATDIF